MHATESRDENTRLRLQMNRQRYELSAIRQELTELREAMGMPVLDRGERIRVQDLIDYAKGKRRRPRRVRG